ncbi:MAG: flagellar assembly protein FliW [Symbiobacterium sp.]|uniref:flagellar assembly protein FliW n=1 Tax=Symbiobacterium sp. TaxID=1971213 RepID=UPI003464E8A3
MENVFEFPAGLYGFPDLKRFVVADVPGGGDVFKQLLALDQPEVGFTLVYPLAFFPDYDPDIPPEDLEAVGAENPEQVLLYAIARVPESVQEATANLRAPLLFNPFTRKARQIILSDDRYQTRERLFHRMKPTPHEEAL